MVKRSVLDSAVVKKAPAPAPNRLPTDIIFHLFGDCFDFALLTVGASKFEATHLKRTQPVAEFDDVYKAV